MNYIYKIYNNKTQKVYIGKTNRDIHTRFQEHFEHENNPFQEDVLKYGMKSFEFSILEELETNDTKYVLEVEQGYIDEYNCYELGYNRRNNFEKPKLSQISKLSKAIFNFDKKNNYINLSTRNDIIGSYHLGQELVNIYNSNKDTENPKLMIRGERYIKIIKSTIQLFIDEGILDSVNKTLLEIILKDFTGTKKQRIERDALITEIKGLEIITYDFNEDLASRRERVKELSDKGYNIREINIITGITNHNISNDIQFNNGINRNLPWFKKGIKIELFGNEFNFRLSIKKVENPTSLISRIKLYGLSKFYKFKHKISGNKKIEIKNTLNNNKK